MNKFDTLVNSILEEGLMSNIKAGLKTAAKAPFKAAGGLAKKAVNPAAYLRGAANVISGTSGALDAAKQFMSGDVSPLVTGLRGAAGALSKTGQAVSNQFQKQKTTDIRKNIYGTTPEEGAIIYDTNYMRDLFRDKKIKLELPRNATDPVQLRKNDTYSMIDKRTGVKSIFKVLSRSIDGKNISVIRIQ